MPTSERPSPERIDHLLVVARRAGRRRLVAYRLGATTTVLAAIAAAVLLLVPGLSVGGSQVRVGSPGGTRRPARVGPPPAPRLRLPHLRAGQACPTTTGTAVETPAFAGVSYGNSPVRLLVGNRTDPTTGHLDLGATGTPGLLAVQTIWYATPAYHGGFLIRGRNLTTGATIPLGDASTPVPGPLEVPAGPTANTSAGYRSVPGATWVTAPGCYGFQIDGNGFHSTIVLDLLAGWIHGQILAVGGPGGNSPTALPGTVRIWRGPRHGPPLLTVPVTPAGKGFTVPVPPGTYTLIATSPRYDNGRTTCSAPPITVRPYRSSSLTITCNRK